jgi:hypothetical protein
MSLIGLDLNATRARAVSGPRQQNPVAVRLEGDYLELPLALSLAERQPVPGRAGVALCRSSPHLACLDFLGYLGESRTWHAGRHKIDAGRALGLVFESLARSFGKNVGIVAALPAYLSEAQVGLLTELAAKAKCPLRAVVPTPVAVVLAAYEQLPWSGLALVVDVDGHGLTWAAVDVGADQVQLLHSQTATYLGRGAWLGKLLDGVAHRCVRQTRRDPREGADTEQSLYDQLGQILDTLAGSGHVELALQTAKWYQRLSFQTEELAGYCSSLVRQALAEMQALLAATAAHGVAATLVMTGSAACLPGLQAALAERFQVPSTPRPVPAPDEESDFGEDLLMAARQNNPVHVLQADAVARAAHELAIRLHRGDIPPGSLEQVQLPLAAAGSSGDGGPPRLNFRGQDYLLPATTFTLGRDPSCDLVFESELYPSVSARHCEIVYERRTYTLRDRSRHGTMVNDRRVTQQTPLHSGDWIRLGPSGPLVRFLGRPSEQPQLMTIA